MIHKSAFSGLTNKEKHASENGQAQGWDAERVKNKQTTKQKKQKKQTNSQYPRKSFERPLESQENCSPETRCGSTFLHSTAQ